MTKPLQPPRPGKIWRNVSLLATCQALMQSCNALIIATSGLVGLTLAPVAAYATLALGLQFFCTMVTTLPASLLMKHIGRRNGFLIGVLFGVSGGLSCYAALLGQQFLLFCAGSAMVGVFNAFGHYYRFAAADVSTAAYRSRAISLVLAGGLVAAFAGPNLANHTQSLISEVRFAGSFASVVVLYLVAAGVLMFVDIPKPGDEERGKRTRTVFCLVAQPKFLVAALGAMISYGAMNLVMVATPIAMNGHGHQFAVTASVIQWHIVGMYAPSFFSGHLIFRFGIRRIMATGSVLLLVAAAINLTGTSPGQFIAALVALGVGWNFLFTGATTLLTECYRPQEKALVQGLNDTMMFATMAVTSATSGYFFHWFGWSAINLGVMPFVLLILVLTLGTATGGKSVSGA